jgi:3'-phosphoadenosine 5'-phosphosulfate sulfotransferase (PAPS reductase)/FAD synthetase
MALLAVEEGIRDMKFVFADTGHEHPITYEYVEYLSEVLKQYCGVGIDWIHADFTQRIINKQRYVYENWAHNGVPPEHIEQAIKTLVPTGNPFLDLCLWKGDSHLLKPGFAPKN